MSSRSFAAIRGDRAHGRGYRAPAIVAALGLAALAGLAAERRLYGA
jgi:hypothetical protein